MRGVFVGVSSLSAVVAGGGVFRAFGSGAVCEAGVIFVYVCPQCHVTYEFGSRSSRQCPDCKTSLRRVWTTNLHRGWARD